MAQKLYSANASRPGPLPASAYMPDGRRVTDLSRFDDATLASMSPSFTPEPEKPDYDPATQRLDWDSEQLVYVVEDLPPPPPPQPRDLTLREFMRLCVEAGGAELGDLASVKSDDNLNLRGMWELLSAGTTVVKDDPDTQAGLGLLESEGYLPNGAQAVLDAWPVQ